MRGIFQESNSVDHLHAFVRTDNKGFRVDSQLTELVTEIEAVIGKSNVHYYSVSEATDEHNENARLGKFRDLVLDTLVYEINKEADRARPPGIQLERHVHEHAGSTLGRRFYGREGPLSSIGRYLSGGTGRPLTVLGPRGSGKSAMMARSADEARALGIRVVERYVGISPRSTDVLTLLQDLTIDILNYFERPASLDVEALRTLSDATEAFYKAIEAASAEGPWALFLDGLDYLNDSNYGRKLGWLPLRLPGNSRVVVSCSTPPEAADPKDPQFEVYFFLTTRLDHDDCVVLPTLGEEAGGVLLDSWLHDSARTLQFSQRTAILNSFCHHGNPMWLRTAATEVAKLPSWQIAPQFPEDPQTLLLHVLRRLAKPDEHGWQLVHRTVSYLFASRRGLSETELSDLLSTDAEIKSEFHERFRKATEAKQLPDSVWLILLRDLEPYLSERKLYGTTLLSISQSITHDVLTKRANLGEFHRLLASFFKFQPDSDRKLDELPWQLMHAGDWDELASLLAKPEYFTKLFQLNRTDAKAYWTQLEKNSRHRLPQTFAEVIRMPAVYGEAAFDISDTLDETAYPDQAKVLLSNLAEESYSNSDFNTYVACFLRLGLLEMQHGSYDNCVEIFQRCLEIALKINRGSIANAALVNLGQAYFLKGDMTRAEALVNKFLNQGNISGRAHAYFCKAQIAIRRGNHAFAEEDLNHALKEAERFRDDRLRADILRVRAALLTEQGRVRESEYELTQLANIFEASGDLKGSATINLQVGVLEKDRGNLEAALQYYSRAEELRGEIEGSRAEAMRLDNQAEVLIRMQRFSEALPLNQQAIQIFRNLGEKRHLAIAMINRSAICRCVDRSGFTNLNRAISGNSVDNLG